MLVIKRALQHLLRCFEQTQYFRFFFTLAQIYELLFQTILREPLCPVTYSMFFKDLRDKPLLDVVSIYSKKSSASKGKKKKKEKNIKYKNIILRGF